MLSTEIPFSRCLKCGGPVVVPSYAHGKVEPRYTCDCHDASPELRLEDLRLAGVLEAFGLRVQERVAYVRNQGEAPESVVQGSIMLQRDLGGLSQGILRQNRHRTLEALVAIVATVHAILENDEHVIEELMEEEDEDEDE